MSVRNRVRACHIDYLCLDRNRSGQLYDSSIFFWLTGYFREA